MESSIVASPKVRWDRQTIKLRPGLRLSSLRGNNRSGITLTEVVVGLALLAGLLTMMLIAAGRLERQRRAAEKRLEAVAVLDRLVSGFFSNGFPALPSSGPVLEHEGMAWQMSKVATPTPDECSVARVSVVQWKGSESTTVASVDVLVADGAFGQNQVARQQP